MAIRVRAADGNVLVSAWIPRPDWKERAIAVGQPDGTVSYQWREPSDIYEGVVELLDLRERAVVASTRLDSRLLYGFLDDDTAYGPIYADDGTHFVDVSALTLNPQDGRR
jgi:hypothetical protein